jgi:hypothetical protein
MTRLANRVVDRFEQRVGMARATVVVDENVAFLAGPLKAHFNFRTVVPQPGMDDETIKNDLLGHRILITKNSKDFRNDAPVYDYGIIALEKLPFIDPSSAAKNATCKMISDAVVKYNLISRGSHFILTLKPDGKHLLETLE